MDTQIETVCNDVNSLLSDAKAKASDRRLTWQDFGLYFVRVLKDSVSGLDRISAMSGPEKKDVAMTAVAALFDSLADKCVPLVAWPMWAAVRPAARSVFLALSSGALEAILSIHRSKA